LIGGSVLAALALSVLAVRDGSATALTAMLLIGAATASLSAATTLLMKATFFPARPVAALNLGHVFFGVGLVLGPMALGAFLRSLRWRRGLLLLALFYLAPALIAALTPASDFPNDPHGDVQRAFNSPVLWLAGLICFFYLPVELSLVTWATTKLTTLGYSARQATWLMACFWAALLGGRLLMMLLVLHSSLRPGKEAWVLLGLGLAVAVALGNLAGAARRSSIAWGLVLAGFFCGPIYPTLIGSVLGRFHEEPGTAFGATAALGSLGVLLMAPLIASPAQQKTAQHLLRVPLIASLLLAGAALVLGLNS
jgi:fucose permease